jgi:predicted enzyme related to lactoylglutathione lyase
VLQLRQAKRLEQRWQASTRVTALGGQVLQPKAQVSGQGWYGVVADPEGNAIALWQRAGG